MSIFGDIAKGAKKAFKKVKKLGGKIAEATREVRPVIGLIPGVGRPIEAGLAALDPGQERARKKKGQPSRRPGVPLPIGAQLQFLQRTQAAALRQARAGRPPLPTAVQAATGLAVPRPVSGIQPIRPLPQIPQVPGRIPMATLQPVGAIPAQPAGFRLRVPPVLRERARQLGEALPFTFGAPAAPTALVPLTESVDKIGRPLIVQAGVEQRVRCPPGYLAVTMPDGSRACVLAGVAIAAGLAKRRRKPLISVKETRAMQVADRARSKLKRVTTKAGFTVREKRTTRRKMS